MHRLNLLAPSPSEAAVALLRAEIARRDRERTVLRLACDRFALDHGACTAAAYITLPVNL